MASLPAPSEAMLRAVRADAWSGEVPMRVMPRSLRESGLPDADCRCTTCGATSGDDGFLARQSAEAPRGVALDCMACAARAAEVAQVAPEEAAVDEFTEARYMGAIETRAVLQAHGAPDPWKAGGLSW